jgi:hypothetical protein
MIQVRGPADYLDKDLGEELTLVGRIVPDVVWKLIPEIVLNPLQEIILLKLGKALQLTGSH